MQTDNFELVVGVGVGGGGGDFIQIIIRFLVRKGWILQRTSYRLIVCMK